MDKKEAKKGKNRQKNGLYLKKYNLCTHSQIGERG